MVGMVEGVFSGSLVFHTGSAHEVVTCVSCRCIMCSDVFLGVPEISRGGHRSSSCRRGEVVLMLWGLWVEDGGEVFEEVIRQWACGLATVQEG